MVAYQAESDLLALLRPHYARADQEGRTLLHELFTTAGDIRVCDSELHITLAPLSSPHRTHAAQALCEMLDQTATLFPGSRLRMRFAVRSPPRIGLAFPGSRVERSATPAVAPVSPIGAKTGHFCATLCQEVRTTEKHHLSPFTALDQKQVTAAAGPARTPGRVEDWRPCSIGSAYPFHRPPCPPSAQTQDACGWHYRRICSTM